MRRTIFTLAVFLTACSSDQPNGPVELLNPSAQQTDLAEENLVDPAFPKLEDQGDAAMKAIELVQSGKDGTFEVTEDFAECAGLFDALAYHFTKFDGAEDMSKNMSGLSNGAELTAMYFWGMHSEDPKAAIIGIKEGSEIHFKSLLSVGGVEQAAVSTPMARCGDLNKLQQVVIKEVRKSY